MGTSLKRWPGVWLVIFMVGLVMLLAGAGEAAGGPQPFTTNPFGQANKISASDAQMNDDFGGAIAVDGSTLVVGAAGEAGGEGDPLYRAGAAYVFEQDAGGPNNWGQVAKLTAEDAGFFDEFGRTVAVSGDTIAVGAPNENGGQGNPLPDAGAVYIFQRNQGGPDNWGQLLKITAEDADPEDDFGQALSLSGDTLVVGAPGEDGGEGNPMSYAGAVYIFERDQGGPDNWGQVAKLHAGNMEGGDGFGQAVAIQGDTLVAGAPAEDGGPGNPVLWAGAAYIFERDLGGPDNWGEVIRLTTSDMDVMDRLGTAVAIDGDTIVAGAPFEKGGPGDPLFVAGAAYVFERNQGGTDNWGEVVKLSAGDPDEGDFFANQLAVRGDTIIAGTPYESGGPGDPLLRAGAAYLFERNLGGPGSWGQLDKIMAADAGADDIFGSAVAINSGGLLFVGALDGDVDGPPPVTNSGAAYIFEPVVGDVYSIYIPVIWQAE